MLQTTDPSPDLASEISRYHGNVYNYLIALLRNPDRRDADIGVSLGLQGDTPAAWMYQHPGLRDLRDRIRASAADLRLSYARAAMLAAVPDAVDTMVAVAKDAKARDGQRARERILEQVGVLRRQSDLGDVEHVDLMAARIFYKARPQAQALESGPIDTVSESSST